MRGMTVLEGAPRSAQADEYRDLAKRILNNKEFCIPTPMTDDEFEEMLVRVKNSGGAENELVAKLG
jgi:nitrogenase iron protein NifH